MSEIIFVERMEKRWASRSKKAIGNIDQSRLLELARKGAEAATEIARLKEEVKRQDAAIRLAHALVWEARLFNGYSGGPLHQPAAEQIERMLEELRWPPRAALNTAQEKTDD
jgi:hypothetical protein